MYKKERELEPNGRCLLAFGLCLWLFAAWLLVAPQAVLAYRYGKSREQAAPAQHKPRPRGALSSSSALLHNNRGVDLYISGKYQESISEYNAALRLRPNYAEAYNNRGAAYDALKEDHKAVEDYSSALRCRPSFISARLNRAAAYKDLARLEDAIADCQAVIKMDPSNSAAFNLMGECHMQAGAYADAAKDFGAALRFNKRSTAARKNKELALTKLKESKASLSSVGHKGSPVPEVDGVDQAGAVAGARGQEAESDASRAAAARADLSAPTEGSAAEQVQPVSRERPLLGAARERPPFEHGQSQLGRQSLKPARSVHHSPLQGIFAHLLGNIMTLCGRFDDAVQSYSDAIAANPADSFAYYRRANALALQGKTMEALSDYEQCMRLSPRFVPARWKRDSVQTGRK